MNTFLFMPYTNGYLRIDYRNETTPSFRYTLVT